MDNGAVATFWSLEATKAPSGIRVILVDDPLKAMQDLAKYYLAKVGAEVVAITGSNGKTTTKDLTASVLAQKYKTYKTQGNYNNNIGLPYTKHFCTCRWIPKKSFSEMGMDHAREITELSLIARPKVAAITMIGEAHIENLGSRAGIAQAKMEIVDGLRRWAVDYPKEEPLLKPLTESLTRKIETFGLNTGELQAEVTSEEKTATHFIVNDESFMIPLSWKL